MSSTMSISRLDMTARTISIDSRPPIEDTEARTSWTEWGKGDTQIKSVKVWTALKPLVAAQEARWRCSGGSGAMRSNDVHAGAMVSTTTEAAWNGILTARPIRLAMAH